jgi:hypothetical protein
MKEKLIQILTKLKTDGETILGKLDQVSNSAQLNSLIQEFTEWNNYTSNILKKSFVMPQVHNMFNGVTSLGNVYSDTNSFQVRRDEIYNSLPKKIAHLNTAIGIASNARPKELLPIEDENIDLFISNTLKNTPVKKLFVSHSSMDDKLIEPLITLINLIGLNHDKIFYCSIPGYGLAPGENIFDGLKRELSNEVFALFMLSKNFYSSPICMCEMGAVWIKSHKQIQILIPPMEFKEIDGVFPNHIGFKLNNKSDLNALKDEIENYFDLPKMNATRWEEKRDEYLTKINELLK